MRFRDFQYDETRASEGRYRVRASEAVKFEEKGERLFRLKDVVFESQEGPRARVVSVRAPRAELVEGSRAFRVFDDVRIEGEETSVSASSFRYEPAQRVLASEGPVAALRAGLVAHAASGRLDVRDGHLVLDGDARLRGRVEGGRAFDLAAPHVVVSRDGKMEATGGAVLKTDRFVLRSESVSRLEEADGSRLKATVQRVPSRAPRRKPAAGGAHGAGRRPRDEGRRVRAARHPRGGRPRGRSRPARSRALGRGGSPPRPRAPLLGAIREGAISRAHRARTPRCRRNQPRRRTARVRAAHARGGLRARSLPGRRAFDRDGDVRERSGSGGRHASGPEGAARHAARARRDRRLFRRGGRSRPLPRRTRRDCGPHALVERPRGTPGRGRGGEGVVRCPAPDGPASSAETGRALSFRSPRPCSSSAAPRSSSSAARSARGRTRTSCVAGASRWTTRRRRCGPNRRCRLSSGARRLR